MPSAAEIEKAKSTTGGWTQKQLAEWGVPWPPPKGWRRKLIKEAKALCHRGVVTTLPALDCGCYDRTCSDCGRVLSRKLCVVHESS